jgi:hypothetical protein
MRLRSVKNAFISGSLRIKDVEDTIANLHQRQVIPNQLLLISGIILDSYTMNICNANSICTHIPYTRE